MVHVSALSASPLHVEDVKSLIRKKYGSLRALGRELGVEVSSISNVIRSPLCSQRLERLIAEKLGLPPQMIWPERWMANGEPIPPSARRIYVAQRIAAGEHVASYGNSLSPSTARAA